MHVIIVGAGIAGLSLAIALSQSRHQITILDAAPELTELGAGVQMTPQAIRYLFKWGLKDDLLAESIIPENLHVWDGQAGNLLGSVRIKEMEAQYGAPYIVVHRAVLHAILHRHAVQAGARLLLSSDVIEYDFANGAVKLQNGKRLTADLVVAADGAYTQNLLRNTLRAINDLHRCRDQFSCSIPAAGLPKSWKPADWMGRFSHDGGSL